MDQIEIGKFIASLRKESGLTQQALGEELGITNKTISRWENGVYMSKIKYMVDQEQHKGSKPGDNDAYLF